MIELRYLKTKIETLIANDTYVLGFDNVLQFRTMQNIEEIGIYTPIWSKWQDVPVVIEEESIKYG